MPTPNAEALEFASSLPPSYRDRYAYEAVQVHARLAAARQDSPVRLGVFDDTDGRVALAVVTDNRPGILALTTSALTSCGIEIADAEFYVRTRDQGGDALTVFWPQEGTAPLTEDELARIDARLRGLLDGRIALESLPKKAREAPAPNGRERGETRIRFLDGSEGELSVLEIETADRSGLLLSLTRALFAQKVQILRSEVRTSRGGVSDRFVIVEPNGTPISPARRLGIQVAVLDAIDPARD